MHPVVATGMSCTTCHPDQVNPRSTVAGPRSRTRAALLEVPPASHPGGRGR